MYIDTVPNRNSPPAVLLRESFRQHGKVKKRTIANLSKCPDHVVDGLRILLKGGIALRSPNELLSILRSYPHGHVGAVLGSLHQLGLHSLIARPASRQRDLVLAMIVARVVDARSKLATARGLNPESAVSSLGHLLQLGSVDENELYAAMDWLVARQHGIEQRLAKRHLHDNTLLLYDLTSSFFEGHTCPLARRGHSRDGKRGTLQIVFGLLCTAAGCPIAVEVFEGSTSDPKTVAAQVDKIRNRFGLQRVVLVGDRGMLTGARIREDLKGVDGLRWITTLRAPTIRKLIKAGAVAQTMFDERDLAEISSPEFPGERLIVCRNPVLAEQRQRKRQELLAATEKDLLPIVTATQRAKEPLRGAAAIGVRVGKVINGHKMGKHFITTITDDSFSFARDLEKIATEEELDGLYIVRSNVEPELFDAEQTVTAYKDLAKVERAFRSMKTVDLKVRPIYHRNADRVRAHVFLCLLAYYVEWHLRTEAGAGAVRRPRPRRWRAAAGVGGATGATVTGGTPEGGQQAHRRRSAGAQLSRPDERVGDADGEPRADGGQRHHVHHAQRTDSTAAALFRSPGGQPSSVARSGHRLLSVIVTSITI